MSRAETYLALCLLDAFEDQNLDSIRVLLAKHGANPNVTVLERNVAPVHLVIGLENPLLAEQATSLLLEHGANPNLRSNEEGMTPLHIAASLGRHRLVQMLMKAGGDINLKDNDFKTPVQYAIEEGHFEVVKIMQNIVFEQKFERKREQMLQKETGNAGYYMKCLGGYLKIASHLKKSERLKACPRCAKPSRVVLSKSTVKLALAAGALDPRSMTATTNKLDRSCSSSTLSDSVSSLSSATVITVASPVSPGNADRIRRNLFSISSMPRACSAEARSPTTTKARLRRASSDTSASCSLLERKMTRNGSMREQQLQSAGDGPQCDYAVCSGKSCGFMFCIKCLCEYHPDTVCKDLSPNSPSKEEHPAHNIACSKQSRRSLLRLRK